MPKPRKSTTEYCMTVEELKAEMRKISKGMNALTNEITKLKSGTRITVPGVPAIRPSPLVVGTYCKQGLWEGKLAIREIGPAANMLGERLCEIGRYLKTYKLRK